MNQPRDKKLSVKELAEALYEGLPHVQNLAEKLARQHGEAEALTFFNMMGEDIQNFWMHIAQQLIDHARCWQKNSGSACVLNPEESKRIHELPRHPEL
jgi:hypothetical protein